MVALALGVVAGVVTTVAGMGGGIVMMLALSAYWGDPVRALAVTAPALLLGNLHRLWLYRGEVVWKVAGPFAMGIFPGALVGGYLAVSIPPWVVQALMVAGALAAVAHTLGWLRVTPGAGALLPAGAGIGVLGGTVGGTGFVSGPLLLASGLRGGAYLATGAIGGITLHAARSLSYGLGGAADSHVFALGCAVAVAIAAGNGVGARLRERVDDHWMGHIEVAVAVGAVALALAGLWRA